MWKCYIQKPNQNNWVTTVAWVRKQLFVAGKQNCSCTLHPVAVPKQVLMKHTAEADAPQCIHQTCSSTQALQPTLWRSFQPCGQGALEKYALADPSLALSGIPPAVTAGSAVEWNLVHPAPQIWFGSREWGHRHSCQSWDSLGSANALKIALEISGALAQLSHCSTNQLHRTSRSEPDLFFCLGKMRLPPLQAANSQPDKQKTHVVPSVQGAK